MEKFLETKNIVAIILSLIAITATASYKFYSTSQKDYSNAIIKNYQKVAEVKNNLKNAADNLNPNNADQNNFLQILETSKEILSNENKKLNQLEVPEKNSDAHKKIIDCLKTEYNLLDRLKENFSIQNEYEAADNFSKSKELFTNLKEQSAFLSVEGNNFEGIFELSAVSEKLEKYFNAKKQLRYDRDQKEQTEREKAAAEEKAKQQAAAEAAKKEERRKNHPLGYHWIQDERTGIFMENPSPTDGETISWSGDWIWNGNYKFAHGYGTTTWIRYGKVIQVDEGTFIQGRRNGEFRHQFFPSGRIKYSYWSNGIENFR